MSEKPTCSRREARRKLAEVSEVLTKGTDSCQLALRTFEYKRAPQRHPTESVQALRQLTTIFLLPPQRVPHLSSSDDPGWQCAIQSRTPACQRVPFCRSQSCQRCQWACGNQRGCRRNRR